MKYDTSMTSNSNAGLGELRVRGCGCGGSCGGGGVRLGAQEHATWMDNADAICTVAHVRYGNLQGRTDLKEMLKY